MFSGAEGDRDGGDVGPRLALMLGKRFSRTKEYVNRASILRPRDRPSEAFSGLLPK
jgi:hypothetical protein